ncbi:hypothetical protein [uncultured Sphingomonas sp.]|uniref:hypothetical protein n=1 Tax=uncultured Sphingomonas sp. TaxID=158754 RepID=UPI0025D6A5FB|nr:hypothetical protein [uncultured Sphingomonas sp.]
MTPPQDSVSDVERLRAALHEIANVRAIGGHCTSNSCCARMENIAIATLSVPINKIGEDASDKARGEAIALLDEINERADSRAFYGIRQTLHAKLCTIRKTLARPDWQGRP